MKLVQVAEMENAFTEVNKKAKRLEIDVEMLKVEASATKETSIVELKESDAYKSKLTRTAALFMANERIKTKSL